MRARLPSPVPALLACAATTTAICLSALAGWQRGGWLPERLLWVAIGVVLVVSAHLLPALVRGAPVTTRFIGSVLWGACMVTVCAGHVTFFLFAQQHAGQTRAAAFAEPAAAPSTGRSLTQIADDRAAAVAELTARCSIDCAAKRTALRARLDALDVEASEARRQEARADRVEAQQDRATEKRDEIRADPVTSRIAALVGIPVARVDLLTGLVFAAVLELTACFCWVLAFEVPQPLGAALQPVSQADGLKADTTEPVTPVVAASVTSDHERVMTEIAAGRVRCTVADIRRYLGCSQSRAMSVRRQLVGEGGLA